MKNIKKIIHLLTEIENITVWIVILIFLAILSSLFGLGMGHGLRVMVESSIGTNWNTARMGLLIFVLVLVVENLFRIINPFILSKFEQDTQIKIRTRLVFWAVQNYSKFEEEDEKGNYIEAITNDAKKITRLIKDIINSLIEYPITAAITIVYLILTSNFIMMLVGIMASLLSGYISKKVSRNLIEISRSEREQMGKFTQFVKELFCNIELWKSDESAFNWALARNGSINQEIRRLRREQSKFLGISNIFQIDVADTFTRIIIMIVGSYLIFNHAATTGDLVAFIFLFHRVVRPFQNMFDFMNNLNSQMGTVEKISYYLDVVDESMMHSKVLSISTHNQINQLNIENLEINMGNNLLLEVPDLVLKKGTIIIIKGDNGSGKTTLVNTLVGHHKEFTGFIKIDGKVIKPGEDKSYFTIAEQEPFVFSSTIKENVVFGDTDFEKLNEVIESTGFNKVLDELKMGLQNRVNNDLSSGQKKLISLSRALYRNTPILIFDEPTESLDEMNIELFKKNLMKLRRDHIILVITHQEELMEIAGKLLVVKNKKLSEADIHDQKII